MSARISGVTLPNKRIHIALTYVYGVGLPLSTKILTTANIPFDKRADDLTEGELVLIRDQIAIIPHEGDLRRKIQGDIKRLSDIGSYRGQRHQRKLPCRGQRTQTNARTRKGRKTTIANKKK